MSRLLKAVSLALSIVAVGLSGCNRPVDNLQEGWIRHGSADGVYSIEYPRDWSVVDVDGILTLEDPEEKGAVNASVHATDLSLADFNNHVLQLAIPNADPVSEQRAVSSTTWQGLEQDFEVSDGASHIHWIVLCMSAGKRSTNNRYVAVTALASPKTMEQDRATYARILQSIRLLDVAAPSNTGID